MSSSKLKNAPLKEVIFELFWDCSVDSMGIQTDEGFDLAQGVFSTFLKPEFPVRKKLVPDNIPLKVFGVPIHQYWKGHMKWPVIQHGQGMIAINEVESGYEWNKTFKPIIISTLSHLVKSYDRELIFNKCRLQYIDVWEMQGQKPEEFIATNLQTQISTNYSSPGNLTGIHIQLNYSLEYNSQLSLNIVNGINNQNQNQSVVLTTLVETNNKANQEGVIKWLDFAHQNTSEMFKKLLKPEFYASLDQ